MSSPPSLAALVTTTVQQARRLVNAQVALTTAELKHTGEDLAKVSILGLIMIGAVSTAGLFGLVAAALGLVAAGLAPWLSFLIVAGALILLAAVAGLLAYLQSARIRGPKVAAGEFEKSKQAIAQSLNVQ